MYRLTEEEQAILNEAIQYEREAELFYLSASDFNANIGLFKAAEFFKRESEDEKKHAEIIREFMTGWNCLPKYGELNPPSPMISMPTIVSDALDMEYTLCEKYKELAAKAFSMNQALYKFLQKFVKIQTQAVIEYNDLMNQLAFVSTPFEQLYFDNTIFAEKVK